MLQEGVELQLAHLLAQSPADDLRPTQQGQPVDRGGRQRLGVFGVQRFSSPDELALLDGTASGQGVDRGLLIGVR